MKLAALLILLLSFPPQLPAGALEDAARELGRRLAPFRPATVTVRNQAGMPAAATSTIRRIVLAEVGGTAAPGQMAAEIRITVSLNPTQMLLVAEAQRGDERRVEIAGRPRNRATAPEEGFPVTIEKQLLHTQTAPMLDVLAAAPGQRMILEPDRVVILDGGMQREMRIPMAYAPARDLTGRLTVEEGRLRLRLDGISCTAELTGDLRLLDCQPETAPATAAIPAAAFRQALGGAAGWEVAVPDTEGHCTGYVLAAPPGGDPLRAYSSPARGVQPASEALDLGGTLTALWPARGGATAIVYEEKTDRYAAYSLALTCSR